MVSTARLGPFRSRKYETRLAIGGVHRGRAGRRAARRPAATGTWFAHHAGEHADAASRRAVRDAGWPASCRVFAATGVEEQAFLRVHPFGVATARCRRTPGRSGPCRPGTRPSWAVWPGRPCSGSRSPRGPSGRLGTSVMQSRPFGEHAARTRRRRRPADTVGQPDDRDGVRTVPVRTRSPCRVSCPSVLGGVRYGGNAVGRRLRGRRRQAFREVAVGEWFG